MTSPTNQYDSSCEVCNQNLLIDIRNELSSNSSDLFGLKKNINNMFDVIDDIHYRLGLITNFIFQNSHQPILTQSEIPNDLNIPIIDSISELVPEESKSTNASKKHKLREIVFKHIKPKSSIGKSKFETISTLKKHDSKDSNSKSHSKKRTYYRPSPSKRVSSVDSYIPSYNDDSNERKTTRVLLTS
jgi:hypothetical protein